MRHFHIPLKSNTRIPEYQSPENNCERRNRKYGSCLEAALDRDNIPVSVYENLITQIHHSLPTLHRFLDLKRRMLGVDTLHYSDLYASIVKEVELKYTIEEGQQHIIDALQPLGSEYTDRMRYGFDNRWIDYMPTAGKRSGAYSNGSAYDVHPYILMNWNDTYNSLSTLTHELGHTMHSYLSNTSQPFAKAISKNEYPRLLRRFLSCSERVAGSY